MKPKFWQTSNFKELEKQWDEILEQAGFRDVERLINGERVLRQNASNCYRSAHQIARENKQRYFELLGHGLSTEEFLDAVERLVMERRADGVRINRICDELRRLQQRCDRGTVRLIIRKYEIKWGIKKLK